LAPGEGDKIEREPEDGGSGNGSGGAALPEALQTMRNRNV